MLLRHGPCVGPDLHRSGSNSGPGRWAGIFTCVNPFFDFSQIPDDFATADRNAAWELTFDFKVVDRPLTQRDHR